MTTYLAGCPMTATDMRICEALRDELSGTGSALLPLLEDKIDSAVLVADDRIDPRVVTLNSRVLFGVDDEPPQTRILVRSAFRHGLIGLTLPITVPRGLALLGLRRGQRYAFSEHGTTRTIGVEDVPFQPQARRFMRDVEPARDAPAPIVDLEAVRNARRTGDRSRTGTTCRSS